MNSTRKTCSDPQHRSELGRRRQRVTANPCDVLVGQGAVISTHSQGERQRLLAERHLRPRVHVEQPDALQQ